MADCGRSGYAQVDILSKVGKTPQESKRYQNNKECAGNKDTSITKRYTGGRPLWSGLTVEDVVTELSSLRAMLLILYNQEKSVKDDEPTHPIHKSLAKFPDWLLPESVH